MFRLWGKLIKNGRLIQDTVYKDAREQNRTRKVFDGLEQICVEFDLQVPIWLDGTIKDFQRHSKCRFEQDNFIETIEFDYLEIQVIEEDELY